MKNEIDIDTIWPSPLFSLDFYTNNTKFISCIVVGIIGLVFSAFVMIFIYIQIKVILKGNKRSVYRLDKGSIKSSTKESFLTRDVSDPTALQVIEN